MLSQRQKQVVKSLLGIVHKRFNKESLEVELSRIFGRKISVELGYEDVEDFPDWDFMFNVEDDDEIGGEFDVYVLWHKCHIKHNRSDVFGDTFYVTEVGYNFN